MTLIKIIAVALMGISAVAVVKNIQPQLAVFCGCAASCVILSVCLSSLGGVVGYYYELCQKSGYADYFSVLLKGLGVAILSEIGSDICRDTGESLIASQIEFAGKVEILVIALPLIKNLVSLSEEILLQ